MDQGVGLEEVISVVAEKIFENDAPGNHGIRLAHIAGRGGAMVPQSFEFLCRDNQWRSAEFQLISPAEEELDAMLPHRWAQKKILSSRYLNELPPNDIPKWKSWAKDSEKSRLLMFPVPEEHVKAYWSRKDIGSFCDSRGGKIPEEFPLKRNQFRIEDFDWKEDLWGYWKNLAKEDPDFWQLIAKSVLKSWPSVLEKKLNASVYQVGTSCFHPLDHGQIVAGWLHKLRNLPCLPDTFGKSALPAELCRTTPETQPYINIERFVHPSFDKPNCAAALDLLGVRSEATNIEPLIDRLRALSRAESPPISVLLTFIVQLIVRF